MYLVSIDDIIIFHLSKLWKAVFFIMCNQYFLWGCRKNLKLITPGSESRVKRLIIRREGYTKRATNFRFTNNQTLPCINLTGIRPFVWLNVRAVKMGERMRYRLRRLPRENSTFQRTVATLRQQDQLYCTFLRALGCGKSIRGAHVSSVVSSLEATSAPTTPSFRQLSLYTDSVPTCGTSFPSSMICSSIFPLSLPLCSSARSSSPVDRCVKPNFSTARAHWVPLPEPGPPGRMGVRGARS